MPRYQAAVHDLLHDGFERQAAQRPDAPAVRAGDAVWSYRALNDHAARVAACLAARGIGAEALVVIHMARGAELLAIILGVLKAGAGYVPIDPRLTRPGLDALLAAAGARLIVSEEPARWPGPVPAIAADALWAEAQDAAPYDAPCPATTATLAYAIFTSGSTKAPRLVGIEHRSVARLIDHAAGALFAPEDLAVVPFIDSIGFDASVHQIFATLSLGGTLIAADSLVQVLRSGAAGTITSIGTTPSVLAGLLEVMRLPDSVRVVSLGGEAIPPALVTRIAGLGHVGTLLNFYGPTETTVYSTVARLIGADAPAEAGSGRWIGHPVPGTEIAIVGGEAEIRIAGDGVARGYLGDAGETAARFGTLEDGRRFFMTGDRGRMNDDGSVEWLGRIDGQVKVNGVRLEPEEIEAHLLALPGVTAAAVVMTAPAGGGARRLIGYVEAAPGTDVAALRRALAEILPRPLVPAAIVALPALPLTTSGKLDRRALAARGGA